MKYGFVVAAAGLVALGGCQASVEKAAGTCAELEGLPPLVDGEEEEPPPPCKFDSLSESPYLEMPRSEVMETYLPTMSTVASLTVDYMVHPASRVMSGTSLLESAADAEPVSLGIGECPSEIAVSAIFSEAQSDEVHVARVRLDEADGGSRSARVFASRGERTITLDTTGVTALSEADSEWYVLFEPVSGPARITLRHVGVLPPKVTLTDLPQTAGVVALLRSESLAPDDEHRVVYGRTGFAQGWRLFAEDWYGAVVPTGPADEITLTGRSMPAELLHISVEEPVVLDDDAPTALLMFPPGSALPEKSISVTVPCGMKYRASLDGYGDAEVVVDTPILLHAGESTEGTATCEGEASEGLELRIRGFADGTRGVYVVVTHGGELP